jgi:predicted nucleic acid-binding protein
MKLIAIQDANILIDLLNTGLFDHCLSLNYSFVTVDIIFDELYDHQAELIKPHINSGKFLVIKTTENDLIEIQLIANIDSRISIQDYSALYFAEQRQALLLTGDKRLRTLAEKTGVTVCGVLWILDKLVDTSNITKNAACNFLRQLLLKNKRLPEKECEERLRLWCGSVNSGEIGMKY